MQRIALIAAGLILAAIAIWHPAATRPPGMEPAAGPQLRAPASSRRSRGLREPAEANEALVYVVGAIARPGLYRVHPAGRIEDAVEAAGGLTSAADPAGVNLAAHLADGDEIDVPVVGEVPRRSSASRGRSRTGSRTRSRKKPALAGPIDLNASDPSTLAAVPGLGPALAERIVELRKREGPYDSLDELLDVSGMSASRLDRARDYLYVR